MCVDAFVCVRAALLYTNAAEASVCDLQGCGAEQQTWHVQVSVCSLVK